MGEIVTEVIVILILLVINGVFSMSELAVMTARRTRLEHRSEEEGDLGARAALELAAHPTAFLSTVQIGITLVGVLAGAFGGVGIAEVLAAQMSSVTWLAPYATTLAFAIVVAAITFLSLIIGELVPKRIALGNPERVASLVARPMRVVASVGGPVVRMLTKTTNLVLRVLGLGAVSEAGVTEQDIRAMVEQGAESGVVQEAERAIVENTFRLGDRAVESIMTPRPDVQWVDLSDGPDAVRVQLEAAVRDRFLVCDGTIDHVVGLVHAEDIVSRLFAGDAVPNADGLRTLARESLFVPATLPVFAMLDRFRQSRQHAAIALDEYGSVAGLVSLDDVLEALIGEVPDDAADEPDFARAADGAWIVDATAPLDDVLSQLDLDVTDEEEEEILTLGGFVMSRLGRVPREGDAFVWSGRSVKVLKMKGRRVAQVSISSSTAGRPEP